MNIQDIMVLLNYYQFITAHVCLTLKTLIDLLKIYTNAQEVMVLLGYQLQYMSTSYEMHDDIQDVVFSWIINEFKA